MGHIQYVFISPLQLKMLIPLQGCSQGEGWGQLSPSPPTLTDIGDLKKKLFKDMEEN